MPSCSDPAAGLPSKSPLVDTDRPLPSKLSEVGLFPEARSGDYELLPEEAIVYEPAWELWSNGGSKLRTVSFPAGTVDNTDPDNWSFAAGTVFTKTFFFFVAEQNQKRPIETRLLRLWDDGPEYGIYVWDDAGVDAELSTETTAIGVPVNSEDGEDFLHSIPSYRQCAECHEAGDGVVLGFTEIQLNHAQDGGRTWLANLGDYLADGLPAAPNAISLETPLATQVAGYVYANCTHCHDGSGGQNASFSMLPDKLLANTINQPTQGNGLIGTRIVPGDPESSVLFMAFRRDNVPELKAMPPVAVQRADTLMVETLREWIAGLDPADF